MGARGIGPGHSPATSFSRLLFCAVEDRVSRGVLVAASQGMRRKREGEEEEDENGEWRRQRGVLSAMYSDFACGNRTQRNKATFDTCGTASTVMMPILMIITVGRRSTPLAN
uniref:Uncharacterized protein n=1 Tax=Coccidioides posadasii RMSCC 3488 TaxID=454284 RepID=A0A0J6ICE1_COCPO|nr:hypothetical protein CPAG_05659 [Coccidioides posadasii RMSCC 3488]